MFRRMWAITLAFTAITALATASAQAVERHAALIIDANTGAVLHNDDADQIRHPASLTKMMTLYLTFETLESGRLKMSDMVTVSEHAASVAPSKLDLDPGDQISVADAIKAIVTKSANDIAVALAEKIGGTEANFVRLMNTRAREIGMSKTHFENPSGLPDDAHVSTAHDMATLALHLMDDYPSYYPLFATRTFTYQGKTYRNHNTMLNSFAGVDGIKTGYTRASGFNLVTSLHRGRLHLIGVVFGGSTAASRNREMRILLTRALSRASQVKTRKPALIARLQSKPAPATRPAAKRTQVAAADAPVGGTPVAATPHTPQVAAVLRDMANASRQLAAAAAEPEAPDTPVHVFKVRHIPLVLKPDAAASPDETTDMEDTDTQRDAPRVGRGTAERTDLGRFNSDRQSPVQAFAGFDPGASDQTLVAKSAVPTSRPSASDGQIEMLGAADRAASDGNAAETSARATPIAFAPPDMMRGRAPSTLDAQSRSLQTSPEPQGAEQASAVPAAAGPASSTPAGRYEVQIGAYGSIAEAQRALTNVQDRAGKLLAGIASVTHPAMKNGHQIFRARFAGFNAERANSACTALRREGVDCFVMAGD